jgi:ketosteroid isomerase-like protein
MLGFRSVVSVLVRFVVRELLVELKADRHTTATGDPGLTLTLGDRANAKRNHHQRPQPARLTGTGDQAPALEVAMNELDDFLTPTLTRQLQAEQALINGDPGPRLAMWSTQDPVTIFGRDRTTIGSEEVTQAFHWLATRFSNLTDYRFELVAADASGDLAYTLGYEHVTFSIDGGPVEPITLRVTHLYRREDGEWKTVHRHADDPPTGPLPSADTSTE